MYYLCNVRLKTTTKKRKMLEKIENIKFRGKNKDNQWVYGSLNTDNGYAQIGGEEVDETTIGMFTTLHDCNGKEIYELDIIQTLDSNIIGYVAFLRQEAGFVLVFQNGDTNLGERNYRSANLEVIGNMVDNNELLWDQEYTTFREKYTTL